MVFACVELRSLHCDDKSAAPWLGNRSREIRLRMMSAINSSCPVCDAHYKPLQSRRPGCGFSTPRCYSNWTASGSSTSKRKSQQRAQSARKASKPKSSDHPGGGHSSDDRTNSNAQAGTSGIDRQPSQKPSKLNKQVLLRFICMHY